MFLHFKANVNDKYDTKTVYRKGEVYELDDKRAKELLKTLPSLVEEVVKDKKHRAPRSKPAADETNKDAATDSKPESDETAEQDESSTPQEPEPAADETNKE